MKKPEKNLNKNTGKYKQAKSSKNAGKPQTEAKKKKINKCMKIYNTYQYVVEATQIPSSNIS